MANERIPRLTWRRALAASITLVVLAGALYWVRMQLLRSRWDAHLVATKSWYEANIGSLDPDSYRRVAVPEERNAGRKLLTILDEFPLDAKTKKNLALVERRFDLHRTPDEAEGAAPWSAEDEEGLREVTRAAAPFLEQLDAWSALRETSLELTAGENLDARVDGWPLRAMEAARVRLAEVGVALERGDCATASQKLPAIERLAAVLGAETNLLLAILDGAVEGAFLEGTQRTLEHSLRGACSTKPDLEGLREAEQHLRATRVPLARALAAEGAHIWRPVHGVEEDQLAGENPYFMTSAAILDFGRLVGRARQKELPPLEHGNAPSWRRDLVSNMLLPNLEDTVTKDLREPYARRLTSHLLDIALCLEESGCALEDVGPLRGPNESLPLRTPDGTDILVELSPGNPDEATPYRRSVLETIRIPRTIAAAF